MSDYDGNEVVDYVTGQLAPEQAVNFVARMRQDRNLEMLVEIMRGFVPDASPGDQEATGVANVPAIKPAESPRRVPRTGSPSFTADVRASVRVALQELEREKFQFHEQPVQPLIVQPVIFAPPPRTFGDAFHNSVWNRRRMQTALVLLFGFTIAVLAILLVRKQWQESSATPNDLGRLNVVPASTPGVFRLYGQHDKKLYLRSSLTPDWLDVDPFDAEPTVEGPWTSVFQSLRRSFDPADGREMFVLELAPPFEGFVEVYHDDRQLIIVRLSDAARPVNSDADEAKIWFESKQPAAHNEAQRLMGEVQNLEKTKQTIPDELQKNLDLAMSRDATFRYLSRRVMVAPKLLLWSETVSHEKQKK